MQQYFKIGELSKLYGIGTDSIRYYEEAGLIHPRRSEAGYRLYSITDIWRMNVIRDLRSLDFSVPQIASYLESHNVGNTIRLLEDEIAAIDRKAAELQRLRDSAVRRMEALRWARDKPCDILEVVRYDARTCYRIQHPFCTDEEMDVLTNRLLNRIRNRLYIIGNNHIGCRFDSAAIAAGDYRQYDSVFILHEDGEYTIPAGDYLTVRYRGSSKKTREYIPRLQRYAAEKGLTLAGEYLELILIDIHESSDYSEHITEIQGRLLAR